MFKLDEVWVFDDKSLAIQTTVFSIYILAINCQIKMEFVTNGYFKVPFQDPEPKLEYCETNVFVTSHFGTLLH